MVRRVDVLGRRTHRVPARVVADVTDRLNEIRAFCKRWEGKDEPEGWFDADDVRFLLAELDAAEARLATLTALVSEAEGYLRNGSGYREQIADWLHRAAALQEETP